MSSRDWFWFLAGVLVTGASTVLILRAWSRERPAVRPAIPAFALPIAAALGLIGVALGIYFLLGSPASIASAHANAIQGASVANTGSASQMTGSSASAGSLDDVTQKLANRLATKGGSDSEWQLLAESYDYMGKPAEAKAARAHIASSPGADAPGSASGTGAPASGAFDGQTMAAVADALDNTRGDPAGSDSSMQPSKPATTAAATGAPQISGSVGIAPRLASRAPAGATLFIYAKQPNAPGPPLAVVRLTTEHWPVNFTLSDANAMVPGRNLSSAQTVLIEARISRTGEALPKSGDLVGTVTGVNPSAASPVKISIDREID